MDSWVTETDRGRLRKLFYLSQVQQKGENDEDVARAIAKKMGDTPGVSYSDIAGKALEVGRPDLAIRVNVYLLWLKFHFSQNY